MTSKSDSIALIKAMSKRLVAFNPIYTEVGCSITATVMLCQLLYWSDRTTDKNGWIYKTQDEMKAETGLTRSEQETARKLLKKLGFISETKRGVPCKVHYKVEHETLHDALLNHAKSDKNPQFAENLQTGLQESCKLDCRNPANKNAETLQSNTEITAENTQKNTADDVAQSATPTPPPASSDQNDEKQAKKKSTFNFARELANMGGNPDLIADWLAVRKTKKATNTKVSFARFNNELATCGHDINAILELCIVMEWRGFGANWLLENPRAQEELQKIITRNKPSAAQPGKPEARTLNRPDITKVKPL